MIKIHAWDRPFIPRNELTERIMAEGHGDKLKSFESSTTRTFKKRGVRTFFFSLYCAVMYDYIEITETL